MGERNGKGSFECSVSLELSAWKGVRGFPVVDDDNAILDSYRSGQSMAAHWATWLQNWSRDAKGRRREWMNKWMNICCEVTRDFLLFFFSFGEVREVVSPARWMVFFRASPPVTFSMPKDVCFFRTTLPSNDDVVVVVVVVDEDDELLLLGANWLPI